MSAPRSTHAGRASTRMGADDQVRGNAAGNAGGGTPGEGQEASQMSAQAVVLSPGGALPELTEHERHLREIQQRYRALEEATGQIIWTADADGQLTGDLGVWCAFTGQRAEQARGWGWLEAVHPDDRPTTAEIWAEALVRADEAYRTSYRLRRHDGVYRAMASRAAAVRDDAGLIREWVGTCTDITERIELEQAQRAHARQLEATLGAMADAVLVFDGVGRGTYVNDAYRRLLALDRRPEMYRMPLDRRCAELGMDDEHGHPIPLERSVAIRVLHGEVLAGASAVEVRCHALDGRELRLSVTGAPLRDARGEVSGGVVVMRDVSERRELERRTHGSLRALLAMAELLVDSRTPEDADTPESEPPDLETAVRAPMRELARLTCEVLGCERVGIVAVDPRTQAQHALAVAGLAPEQEERWWSGQTDIPPLSESPVPEVIARLRAGETVQLDMRQPPLDGTPNPYGVRVLLAAPMPVGNELVGILMLDHGGAVHEYTADEQALAGALARLGALVIERERLVREREEARGNELALREASRRMDAFIGVAGHELRTPLTSAMINVQLALRHLVRTRTTEALSDDVLGALERIGGLLDRTMGQLKRENRLVNDLIEVSRISGERLDLTLAPVDLEALVREDVLERRLIYPERAIALALPLGPVLVRGDADRLSEVVTSYLSNALKYSAEDQPVDVRMRVFKRSVRVSVRDQGPGLPESEHERVWERFHRVESVVVRSGSGVGLGLGLYISRTIVERHGGRVGLRSAPGHGATFWFTLPLARAEDKTETDEDTRAE